MKSAQHAVAYDEPKTLRTTAEISVNEFSEFKSFLNIISMYFNDFSLFDGAFRAWSNDKSCIVETGFPFFKDMYFDTVEIKQFKKTVSALGKKSTITFSLKDNGLEISDNIGPYWSKNPSPDFIDNKYIPYDDMEKKVLTNLDPSKLIVSDVIPKKYVRNMKITSKKISSNCICLKNDKNDTSKGFLYISGKSNEETKYRFKLKRPLVTPMEEGYYYKFPILPFRFNMDHLYFGSYFSRDETVTTIFSTKVNNLFVNIYSQSLLFKDGKEK